MKKTNNIFLSGSVLTATVMAAYIVNFIFNAYLGRILSFEVFGVITFLNMLFYVVSIFYNAISLTLTQHIAFIDNKKNQKKVKQFVYSTIHKVAIINLIISILWLICSPFIISFFQMDNPLVVYLFVLVILLYPLVFITRGYFQGKLFFISVAVITFAEAFIKLLSAIGLVTLHLNTNVYLSLYISSIATVFIASLLLFKKEKFSTWNQKSNKLTDFPSKLYITSLISGLSTISFLALDVILIKHYMDPNLAGQYSLLSLIGKIIYFLGSLLNVFIISLVSKNEGENKNSIVNFYKIFAGSCILAGMGYILLGIFGPIIVPILFGNKALAIIPYLNLYTLTILFFTLGHSIVTFHLAKKQYIFPIISFFASCLFIFGIILFHQDIYQIINTIFITSIINISLLVVFHFSLRNKTNNASFKLLQKEAIRYA